MKSKRLQMALTLLLVFSFMLLFSSALAQTEVGQMAIVTTQTQGLNVRSWPGMDAPVTGCLSMGEAVYVLSVNNGWAYIRNVGSNLYGYVASQWLSGFCTALPATADGMATWADNRPSAFVEKDVLNLRAQPTTQSAAIGSYEYGTEVKVLGSICNEWLEVGTRAGQRGHMYAGYLLVQLPVTSQYQTAYGKVNCSSVLFTDPVYREEGKTYLCDLQQGQDVTILGRFINKEGEHYLKVQYFHPKSHTWMLGYAYEPCITVSQYVDNV